MLVLVVLFGGGVALIPMPALVAVMIMVSVAAFDWHSIRPSTLRRMPESETAVRALTVVTHNPAIAVRRGALLAVVLFARLVTHLTTVERPLGSRHLCVIVFRACVSK